MEKPKKQIFYTSVKVEDELPESGTWVTCDNSQELLYSHNYGWMYNASKVVEKDKQPIFWLKEQKGYLFTQEQLDEYLQHTIMTKKKPISQEEAFQTLMDDVYSGKLDPSDSTIEVVINTKLQKLEKQLQDEQFTLHKLILDQVALTLMISQIEENIKNKKEEIEKEKNS